MMRLNRWSSPQMLRRYGASGTRPCRTYDRIMEGRFCQTTPAAPKWFNGKRSLPCDGAHAKVRRYLKAGFGRLRCSCRRCFVSLFPGDGRIT
jgi:hypothetical protein